MNAIWLMYKRDLASFYRQPLFFMLAGICCLMWSPIYVYAFGIFLTQLVTQMGATGEVLSYHDRVVVEFVALVNFLLLLSTSSIAMKLISEEKKNHTMTLLFVSPIESRQIIVSKFLSGLTVAWSLVGISLLYPLTTAFLGKLYWPTLLSSYLGLLLFAAVYVSIGLFMSTLTSSLIMAFVMTLIANMSLWFLGLGSDLAPQPAVAAFFDYISFDLIFKDFSLGIIRLTSVVFLLSTIFFFLAAADRALEASRWK
ncbi:MAG: ABC transporter permease [Bdellovibrionaceae bacterium]|nr:ABC transporter permease [Pseudobdellovibrionaceae bacterium]